MQWLQTYGPKVLGAMIFFFAAWVVSGWVARLALRGLSKAKLDMTLTKFLSTTVRWSILTVAAVAGLGIFGVQTASFTAVIGSAGLAIGLAMQGSLSNLAAGVMLLLFRPFRVGDTISVAGQLGKVDEIELFSTRLDTADNRRIIIPNGQVFGAIIDNHTHHDTRATGVNVVVDGKHDIELTRQMLLAAANGVPGRLTEPAPAVGLVKLVPVGVEWNVGVWSKTADLASVQQELAKTIKHVMDREALGPAAPVTMLQLPKGVELGFVK
jgi:small conductance mechanosensitive channel